MLRISIATAFLTAATPVLGDVTEIEDDRSSIARTDVYHRDGPDARDQTRYRYDDWTLSLDSSHTADYSDPSGIRANAHTVFSSQITTVQFDSEAFVSASVDRSTAVVVGSYAGFSNSVEFSLNQTTTFEISGVLSAYGAESDRGSSWVESSVWIGDADTYDTHASIRVMNDSILVNERVTLGPGRYHYYASSTASADSYLTDPLRLSYEASHSITTRIIPAPAGSLLLLATPLFTRRRRARAVAVVAVGAAASGAANADLTSIEDRRYGHVYTHNTYSYSNEQSLGYGNWETDIDDRLSAGIAVAGSVSDSSVEYASSIRPDRFHSTMSASVSVTNSPEAFGRATAAFNNGVGFTLDRETTFQITGHISGGHDFEPDSSSGASTTIGFTNIMGPFSSDDVDVYEFVRNGNYDQTLNETVTLGPGDYRYYAVTNARAERFTDEILDMTAYASHDITVRVVPAPGAATLLTLSGFLAARRRR